MRKNITGAIAGIAAVAALGGGVAAASGASGGSATAASGAAAGGSRLDDGKQLSAQAKISEQQAITAAQGAAQGDLNEIDLEHYDGTLVYNVDVGSSDVKVDAASGDVLKVAADD